MFQLPVTATVAALSTFALVALSLNVSRLRMRHRISLGNAGHKGLQIAVRAHGNALEHTLLFLLLLLIAEAQSHSLALLAGASIAFLGACCAHAYGLLAAHLRLRQIGHGVTLLAQMLLAAALWLVWIRHNVRLPSCLTVFVTGGFLLSYWLRKSYGGSMALSDGSEKPILGVNLELFASTLAILMAAVAAATDRRRPLPGASATR